MDHLLEKDIQKQILEYLPYVGIYAWRNNSGVIFGKGPGGKSYAHRMGPKGSSDILGIMPDGRFLAIEVKRPGGIVSDIQKEFLNTITSRKGVGFVAFSLDEVIEKLKWEMK